MESHRELSTQDAIPLWRILAALFCPMAIALLTYMLKLNIAKTIAICIFRTISQLLLAGFVLLGFIFSMKSPIYVVLYLCLMMFIAALEATSRQKYTYAGHYMDSLFAIFLGGGGIGLYGAIVVFGNSPWWDPRILVPTAGMIIGNAISGPSISVNSILNDAVTKRYELELRLAFGASRFECILPSVRSAILAALTPNMNQMAVVGLVCIPGECPP
jgi:putative ABC transport system permease protein